MLTEARRELLHALVEGWKKTAKGYEIPELKVTLGKKGSKWVLSTPKGDVTLKSASFNAAERELAKLGLLEGKEDAPNYRQQNPAASQFCGNCRFASGQYCEKFDFRFDMGFTCDAWEGR